jgi:hypothetical protein
LHYCPEPASDHNHPVYASCIAGNTETHHHNQLVHLDGCVFLTFCPSWSHSCLPSIWNYKWEPLRPASTIFLIAIHESVHSMGFHHDFTYTSLF